MKIQVLGFFGFFVVVVCLFFLSVLDHIGVISWFTLIADKKRDLHPYQKRELESATL
jgi:hypothetical protein